MGEDIFKSCVSGLCCSSNIFYLFVGKNVGPDEGYHYNVSLAYSKVIGIPENSSKTFTFGDITRIPFLYNWWSGRLINLANIFKIDSFILLRFMSLFYSLITLFFVWLISKDIIKKRYYRVLPVFMLANTMMFSFLGGIVTYDTLVNLFLVVSFWSFLLFLKKDERMWRCLGIWIITSLLACATKLTALPLVFVECLIVFCFLLKSKVKIQYIFAKFKSVLFLVALFPLLFINFYIYGINILKYKSLTPSCNQVMLDEECLENELFQRSLKLEEKALELREGKRIRELLLTDKRMNPFDFFFKWESVISPRLYGIIAHKWVVFPRNFSFPYTVLFLFLLIPFIRYLKKSDKQIIASTIYLLVYVFILAYIQHYMLYLKFNTLEISMQGRYLLPVIPAAYLIEVWSLVRIRQKWLRGLLLFLLVVIFIAGNVFVLMQSFLNGGALYQNLF